MAKTRGRKGFFAPSLMFKIFNVFKKLLFPANNTFMALLHEEGQECFDVERVEYVNYT